MFDRVQSKPDVGRAVVDCSRAGVGRALPAGGRRRQQQGSLAAGATRRRSLPRP